MTLVDWLIVIIVVVVIIIIYCNIKGNKMLLDRAKIGKRLQKRMWQESHLISRKALFKRTRGERCKIADELGLR